MVFSNRFVVCILIDGKPAKELANKTVHIPFGSQYSIRLRNKNKRRAVAKIIIDGENVSGEGYVVGANDSVDIHRPADKNVAFKFVSLDSGEAVEFGKNGPNDDKVKGTIRVDFYLEKEAPPAPKVTEIHHHHYPRPSWPRPHWGWGHGMVYGSGPIGSGISHSIGNVGSNHGGNDCLRGAKGLDDSVEYSRTLDTDHVLSVNSLSASAAPASVAPEIKDGCTVEGGMTNQSFYSVYVDTEDTCTSLSVFLQGFDPQAQIQAAPKSKKLSTLEEENAKLREKLAELENENLKKELKKKTRRRKTAVK
jgi:hypothetical protein